MTVSVDSLFWGKSFLWPEGHVLWFNAVLNKGVEWGTEPAHAYFTKHLPKLLLLAYPLGLLEMQHRDKRHLGLVAALVSYIALMSCLEHKETRFIWYILPGWNMMASIALSRWYGFICSTNHKMLRSLE